MRSYKIESYVPEKNFYQGKDARFWSAAFEDCFVIDVHHGPRIISSCRGTKTLDFSLSSTANLLALFESDEPFILPSHQGTLLIYPAWRQFELALVFLLKESVETVADAYQNAKRYAFSMIFDAVGEQENNRQTELENKLCILQFYMDRLFGTKRETNAVAHILMIANLVGCRLHEMSVSCLNVTLDERELDRLGAYLFCVFMTMRRYNGRISANTESENDQFVDFSTHVPQKYGLKIEQRVKEKFTKPTAFDLPTDADFANFAAHPAFSDYKIEEENGAIRLSLPLKQTALLSSLSANRAQKELAIIIFPF